MSRKSVISKRFIGAEDATNPEQGGGFIAVNADYTSEILNVRQTDKLSLHLQWESSSLVADVEVQVRNGNEDTDYWRTLDFGTPIQISGASGEHEILLLELPFTDVRLFIDVTSGSGDVGCSFTAKALGN